MVLLWIKIEPLAPGREGSASGWIDFYPPEENAIRQYAFTSFLLVKMLVFLNRCALQI